MAETASAKGEGGNTNPAAPVNNSNDAGASNSGTDPAKTAASDQGFDTSTISDEDFGKIFADPRTFTHPRFKALNEQAKEAEKLKAANEEAENARLAEEKKYQELAQKHETTSKEWQGKYQTTLVDNKIQAEASKLGITDFDAATKLIDRSGIQIAEDGTVNGVEAAVKALADSKSYLVDKTKAVPPTVGGSTANPADGSQAGNGATRQFKASEIADPAFYKEHQKAIDASMKAGVPIIDDRNNRV